jgi:NDP-sugar pyrophosphorylase family protein
MTLPIAILAGGLATRLGALTQRVPKALVEVAGEPFAFHQLRLLARHGFTEAVFLTGHLGEQIVEAVGDGTRFDLRVRYVPDGPVPLGTGGAIARALPQLGPRFAVIYGDSWLEFDYQAAIAAFRRDGRPALMTVFRNRDPAHANNVEFDGAEIQACSKSAHKPRMRHIDYGFSLFRAEVFEGLPTDAPTDLAAVTEGLARRRLLAAYEVHNRFHEIGSLSGLAEFQTHIAGAVR